LELCRELTGRFRISIVAPHDPGAAFEENMGEIRVLRFPYFLPHSAQALCNGVGILPNFRSSFLGKLQAPCLFAAQTNFLRKLLKQERFDLIHSHWIIPSGFCVCVANRKYNLPHLMTIHSSDLHFLSHFPMGDKIVDFVVKRTDLLFIVSTHLQRLLDGLVQSPARAKVLPMGVSLDQFHPADPAHIKQSGPFSDRYVILYVGKLIHVKGVIHLIRSFALISRQCPDAVLLIAGGGDCETELKAEAQTLGLAENIHFLGPKSRDEIAQLYRQSDVAVVPSIVTEKGETEGLPVVILEAMASGKPVIASRVGSLDDVIRDGDNGMLTTPGDPDALSKAILAMRSDYDARAMSQCAIETASRYSWSHIGEQYAQAYFGLIHSKA